MEDLKEILETHREMFYEKLEAKTGWGKKEIQLLFEQTKADALAKWVQDFHR